VNLLPLNWYCSSLPWYIYINKLINRVRVKIFSSVNPTDESIIRSERTVSFLVHSCDTSFGRQQQQACLMVLSGRPVMFSFRFHMTHHLSLFFYKKTLYYQQQIAASMDTSLKPTEVRLWRTLQWVVWLRVTDETAIILSWE
jgi:hypothetical protein